MILSPQYDAIHIKLILSLLSCTDLGQRGLSSKPCTNNFNQDLYCVYTFSCQREKRVLYVQVAAVM